MLIDTKEQSRVRKNLGTSSIKAAIELLPPETRFYVDLGNLLDAMGDPGEAVNAYYSALELGYNGPERERLEPFIAYILR